ncbi:MAG: tRNA dihydrouridine(20/20a) synthase DusA [Gammaproteobacteria bacterium]|nr:tRNA dihydrouridine(20/20a) synthase DusA [Gammaproteobacteria bacterium]MBI5617306.1 tRNA dihydrouridine(20/20a) synthase DusA [Gammaproteobacteria bacterium]
MLDRTDREYRYFARLLSRQARLYSEMIVTGALVHGDASRFLAHSPEEAPLALQLGGSDPRALAAAARLGADAGYAEINLNVGCPSDRVQSGRIGACLMAEPALVADCVAAMRAAVGVPVTVKARLGIDDLDSYEHLVKFVDTVAAAGCETFIVHARKAWLHGLSPHENRTIPPLDYPRVYRLKRDFPRLRIVLNGGLMNHAAALAALEHVDGVMVGRAAYDTPWLLADVDAAVFGAPVRPVARPGILEAYLDYCEARLAAGARLRALLAPLHGLQQGQPGARRWRRTLGELACRGGDPRAALRELRAARNAA